MNNRLKKPCRDCPFRRTSAAGWLGAGDPAWFVSAALADTYDDGTTDCAAAPCHETINYEAPDWQTTQLPGADACVGALIFYRNVDPWKTPRDRGRADLVGSVEPNHDAVFSTVDEFVEHHESSPARSWELS